ncbi:MAG: hypothetical protein IT223_04500 [Crocinitomicaceae bacterium]|nr:hypothetical protein [Crocinitomicaceae bacterium]
MSILTGTPSWFFLICIITGVIYAGALYFRDRFNRNYGKVLTSMLGCLRFITVALLSFFLLKPIIKTVNRNVEKPVIVIAQDNSESIVTGKDSSFYRNEYRRQLSELEKKLGENYSVKTYRFGDHVSEGTDSLFYNEKLTDFSNLLDEVYNRYSGRNLGALVIASDGLYNKGSNPVYSYKKLNTPIYTIALGDTSVYKDVLLAEVTSNRLAYLGNKFPVRITVEGRKASGENSLLTVSKKGVTLHSEPVSFSGDRFIKTIELTLDATETGLQRYSVSLSPVSNEVSTVNNRKDFFIDVLDSRQKVLLLASAPHPDIAAIREALASNESYKVQSSLIRNFKGNIGDFSLMIFHQLPSLSAGGADLARLAISKNIPTLFIWGSNTDFNTFNTFNLGFSLNGYRNSFTDVNGTVADGFSLFTISDQAAGVLRNLPPLSVPFGEMGFSPGVTSFILQRIGQIHTDKPLIAFNKSGGSKVGLITGEGIWRWRLGTFQQTSSHDVFNEMITKTVQYLASKEDRSLFRVTGKNDFPENEPVIFDAELYNESYEPIANRNISIIIKNEEGNEYKFAFSPDGNRYRLNAGNLPVGNYSYIATEQGAAGPLKETGEFSVSPLQYEITHTIADHRLLYQFARANNGEMFYPDNMSNLADSIMAKKEIVSVSYENKQLTDLINYRWILAILLLMLSLEWILRKRAGTY